MRFVSAWNAQDTAAQERAAAMRERVARLRMLERRAADRSARARAAFEQRGRLLPRERLGLLLDPGMPYLPLCPLAGYLQDTDDPEASLPGGGVIAGIGFVSGVRCALAAADSGIDAGTAQPMGLEKLLRVQEVALRNRLPLLLLADGSGTLATASGAAGFVRTGALLRNLARLPAAGIPVIAVQHDAAAAGEDWIGGLSDVVVQVGAGPGVAGDAAAGHGRYLARDDREAAGLARELVARLGRAHGRPHLRPEQGAADDAAAAGARSEELLSLLPVDGTAPLDLREVMVRLADAGELLECDADRGTSIACAQGRLAGHAVGFIGGNGPLDGAAAVKATHFIQWMDRLGHPLVCLQDTRGGRVADAGGMLRALVNAAVPRVSLQCGAASGAAGHALGGRGSDPHFLFCWPAATTGVAGGGRPADAFATSGLLLDDGVIDPRDTRAVLAFCLDTIADGGRVER